MGEAKRRLSRTKKFITEHPICCFCGGVVPSQEVDHVPSIQMFTLRHRPSGLEFPACERCNRSTRNHEQVAAMLARAFPDPRSEGEISEAKRIFSAVNNNFPGLLEEMRPSFRQQKLWRRMNEGGDGGVLNWSDRLDLSIKIFAQKLALALYYDETRRIVPAGGGVATRTYSNYEALNGQTPDTSIFFGDVKTLRQGRWSAQEQFEYAVVFSEDGRMAAFYSVFRKSFALLSYVHVNASEFPPLEGLVIRRPGIWS